MTNGATAEDRTRHNGNNFAFQDNKLSFRSACANSFTIIGQSCCQDNPSLCLVFNFYHKVHNREIKKNLFQSPPFQKRVFAFVIDLKAAPLVVAAVVDWK